MTDYVTMPDGSQDRLIIAYTTTEYTDLKNSVTKLLKKNGTKEALEKLLAKEHKLPAFVHDYMRARFHVSRDDYVAALPFIESALNRLESHDLAPTPFPHFVPQQHDIQRDIYGMAGEVFANCGKEKEAKRAYEDYQLVICRIHSDESYEDSLLSFRKYNDYSLQDLINDTLTVSSPKRMNDPYDTLLLKWGEVVKINKSKKLHTSFLCESFNAYRIRSFFRLKDENGRQTISNVLMWSHYADEHKGFCIQYKFSKEFFVTEERRTIRFKDIKYHKADEPLNLNTNTLNTDVALCLKLDDWSYENESRIITYLPDEAGDFVSLPLGVAVQIKAIFFGYLCPDETIRAVKNALRDKPKIKFYRMVSDYSNIFSLRALAL